jgi:3-hydroxy-9,10-secoandrosta-1,3,5(10)-triene-9,17-dione monooxygenase
MNAIDPGVLSPDALHAEMVARARALGPVLRARCADAEAARRLPAATVADFHAAGFFRLLQPKRWGGFEANPRTFFAVQIEVAKACPSSAWALGVVAVHNWQLALFDLGTQTEVWGEDPSVLISSSYAPTGKAERTEGGFILSGRWSFSSGSEHCGWAFLGAFAPPEPGAPAGPPDMRTFLIPRSDYRIEDTWKTFALKATGSNDVVVDGVFVPEHHTHKMSDGFRCKNPGNASNPGALYRLPFGQIFVRSVSTTAIGIAEGALDFYREVTRVKVGAADGVKAADSPDAALAVAQAASAIDQLKLVFERDIAAWLAWAERGEAPPIDERVAWRWHSAEVVDRCAAVVDELFSLCGARALFTDSPMHRFFLDVHGARAHYANRPETSGRNYGRVQLGHRTQDFFL